MSQLTLPRKIVFIAAAALLPALTACTAGNENEFDDSAIGSEQPTVVGGTANAIHATVSCGNAGELKPEDAVFDHGEISVPGAFVELNASEFGSRLIHTEGNIVPGRDSKLSSQQIDGNPSIKVNDTGELNYFPEGESPEEGKAPISLMAAGNGSIASVAIRRGTETATAFADRSSVSTSSSVGLVSPDFAYTYVVDEAGRIVPGEEFENDGDAAMVQIHVSNKPFKITGVQIVEPEQKLACSALTVQMGI